MIRSLIVLVLAVIAVGSAQPGAIERRVRRDVTSAELRDHEQATRYVDMGVTLHVLRKDPAGRELIKGCPLSVLVRTHHLGGMVDTWGEGNGGVPYRCGPSRSPAIWTCSEQMESLIVHGDELPSWILCTGGMGAGKTTALAQWVYCRVLEHLGHDRQIGVFAPTAARMTVVLKAIRGLWRPSWMVGGRLKPTDRDGLLTFRAGPSALFVSAHRQSEAEGSRIAGFNLVAGAADEMQDFFVEWPNIVARLRSDPRGKNKLFASCTAKDDTAWRSFREGCERSNDWRIVRIPGIDSPFIPDENWRKMRDGGLTARAWQQIALAMDVGPEAAVYHCWSRKDEVTGELHNLRPIPLGAEDVTAQELAAYGKNIGLLVGNDPGKRQHVSVFLKAYRFPGKDTRPRWFVVEEITSPFTTVNSHAQEVLARAREKYGCNTLDWKGRPSESAPQVLVRIDPHTRGESAEHPGRDQYAIWRALGMLAKAAAYKPGSTEPATIKRESRIDMVNTLLCATTATGTLRRLFILCDDRGKIAAPKLLAAFESMERNAGGESEQEKKDEHDLSHWPCAVGLALWQVEHPRMMAVAS